MSIGETLARARRDACLSIAEISSQTRIRQSVIDDIERDDYSTCGGDFYARGNIRAIAQAVGVDSEPLIEAYDSARGPGEWVVAARPTEPVMAAQAPGVFTPAEESGSTADDDTQPIMMGEPAGPGTIGEPQEPITPAAISGPVRLTYADRRPSMWIALGAALLAVAVLGGILLVLGTSGQVARHGPVAGQHRSGGRGATHPAGTRQPSPGHSASSLEQTPSASPASGRTVSALVPASIAAFGPGGTGQGDHPQLADHALAGKAAAPWHSEWYATAHFGNLKSGTGLLLDMGRTVTITSARVVLTNGSGADIALRIGSSPSLASLPPVAHANDVGGVVQLKSAPTRGRYVLVWFTRLPPDQTGTFRVSVYDIKLRGYQ